MAYLLSYTRLPVDSVIYDPRLAYSMHLAISEDGENYQALNHNSGVLFVKATENEDGSLTPWSLKNPVILELKDGGFGVVAEKRIRKAQESFFILPQKTFWIIQK